MRSVLLLMTLIGLTGCGNQISDYVTSGGRRPASPNTSTPYPFGSKISPGANMLTGTNVKSQVAITPTHRTVSGSQVKSTFTFHQNRPD